VPGAFAGTERFSLVRRLGEGGFGVVYEAVDRSRSVNVALKVLRHAEGTPLYRFKREFRALADIAHPNLVTLHELLTDGWHWFFTMDLVRGLPFVPFVRSAPEDASGEPETPKAQLNESALRSCLAQLVEGLHVIHEAGIVHCDVKPSNVLVTRDGRVVLLDFGLVSERIVEREGVAALDASVSSLAVIGTPAYMAPEQARSSTVTPAADFYSVGVMLYQALTGELPFRGSHLEVIDAKQRGAMPTFGDDQRIPPDLADLTLALLQPEPSDRPSAQSVLTSLNQTAGSTVSITVPTIPTQTLFGRDSHLAQLHDAALAASRGETVVALVSGPSGMGKTALLRRFLHDEQREDVGLLTLSGRCYERESMPYKAIDPLIDALAQHLKKLRDIEVARLLPRDAGILAHLFPVLLGVPEVRRAPAPALDTLDTQTMRQRAAGALRDLLFGLAVRAPLVMVIDDAQWGDADSGSILQEVLRAPDSPAMLLIAAFRADDADQGPLLQTLQKSFDAGLAARVVRVDVGPLSLDDATSLAARLTAGQDGARHSEIARESRGNAFFIHELAQHATTVGGSTSLDAVVLDRVSALNDVSRRLLMSIALSAQAIPADVARAAARIATNDAGPLQILRALRLVRTRPGEPLFETYHDRIREAVSSLVVGQALKTWHHRLAAAWEDSGLARPETLVAHYLVAGDEGKTSRYAAAAAERAERALAFDRAAEYLDVLVQLERDLDRRRHWLTRLGQAHANAGRGHQAAGAYLQALEHAPTDDAIELERRAASELIRAGYLDEAAGVIDRLLSKVGVRAQRSTVAAFATVLKYRLFLALRGTAFTSRSESEIPAGDLRRIDVLRAIGEPLALSSLIQGNALNFQAAWHAFRAGEPRRVILGLTALATMTSLGGTRSTRRVQKLVAQADKLAGTLKDAQARGRVALAQGLSLKISGNWKRGVEQLEAANLIFAGLPGARWEIQTAQISLYDALYWMGEWARLAREVPARRQDAEQRGDLYSATHIMARLSPLVHLAHDRVAEARADADHGLDHWTKRHFHLQHRFGVCTGVDIELYCGDAAAARARLEASWRALTPIMFVFQNGRIEMRFYRARVALAGASRGDSAALRAVSAESRRLARENAPWASALAMLLRASVAYAGRRDGAAARRLETAEAALLRCDMFLYAAAARYRRGSITDGEQGLLLMESARQMMQSQQIANPSRLAGLLAPGPWPERC
jgi:serine/threonine protein kinase